MNVVFIFVLASICLFTGCDKLSIADSGTRVGDVPVATENRSASSQPSRIQREQELERRRQQLDKAHPYEFLTDDEIDRVVNSADEDRARNAADAVRAQNQARQAEEASARACRKACNMSDDYGLCIRRCSKP